jgi:hypothetical protein
MLPVIQDLHLRCSRALGSTRSGHADHDSAGSRKFFSGKTDSFHEASEYVHAMVIIVGTCLGGLRVNRSPRVCGRRTAFLGRWFSVYAKWLIILGITDRI